MIKIMKKIYLSLILTAVFISFQSCRETTEEKTEDAIEAMGEDIEHNTRKAAEELEKGAEKVEIEIEEEFHETDDVDPEIEKEEEL